MDNDNIPPVLPAAALTPPQLPTDSAVPPVLGTSNAAKRKPTARWKKRSLLIVCVLMLFGGILSATSPKPDLLRRSENISATRESSISEVAQRIDAAIDENIATQGLIAAPKAPWQTIARRMSLALVGNGLSLEELRTVEQIPESDREAWWSEYLLQDRRFADYFAERWTRATVGTNQGPFLIFRRRKYRDWLADHIEKNTPYDVIVRRLLESDGSWTDSPEVNFLTATMDDADNKKPDVVRLAGRTTRAFLAMRIDCLQCHQDYLGNVKLENADPHGEEDLARTGEQTDFHQLAAFFAGVRMDNPMTGLQNGPGNYKVKLLNEEEETEIEPKVPFRKDLLPSSGDPRHQLAIWVTHRENKPFARAAVNRTWALMFGKPIVEPVDSIPLYGPFPPALEILAEDFAAQGFDMKRLVRTILSTRVFQRDSRIDEATIANATEQERDELTQKHEDCWAVFPLTQLRPEQVAASIHQACRIKVVDGSSSIFSQLEMFGGINDFTQAYGDKGEDEFVQQSVTIPQRLLVMNGNYISERIDNNPITNASTRIAQLTSDDKVAVETAYLSTLNRLPTGAEMSAFCERLKGLRGGERANAVGSMFWVLLNSTEFQWNH